VLAQVGEVCVGDEAIGRGTPGAAAGAAQDALVIDAEEAREFREWAVAGEHGRP